MGQLASRPSQGDGLNRIVTEPPVRRRLMGWAALVASILAFLALVFSWLVFPIYVSGEDVLLETGGSVKDDRQAYSLTLSQFLTREWAYPGGIEVKAMYANEVYFEKSDRGSLTEFYDPANNHVFFVTEDVHTGLLPVGLPDATLRIGDHYVKPAYEEGPEEVSHHRLSVVTFPKQAADGSPYVADGEIADMRLILSHTWDRSLTLGGELQPIATNFAWGLPLEIPAELLLQPTLSGSIMLSLSVGMLSAVLTPCLLQLAVIFVATLGASGAEAVSTRGKVDTHVRRRVLTAALAFVIGYFVLFTAAGALIGVAGKQAQIAFSVWARPISIAAGVLVILFGLWLGIRSNAPLMCKLPGAGMMQRMQGGTVIGNAMIAIVYNLGCMTCFGGAIIATLFIYVGALGSAWAGAVTMGAFALGLSVPFLLAALFFAKVEPLITAVARHQRGIGLVSSLVVILFGVLLLTDNFHTFSDMLYPLLGLD